MKHRYRQMLAASWVTAALVGLPSLALGQSTTDKAVSDQLFERAVEIRKEASALKAADDREAARKKFEEACAKFDESDRLYHSRSKRGNLAECYAEIGRVSSARVLFRTVADEYKATGDTAREGTARKRAEEMRERTPSLALNVSPGAAALAGLFITRNGTPVGQAQWGEAIPLDPGEYIFEATAPGKKPWRKTMKLAEKEVLSIEVPALEAEPPKPAPLVPPPPAPKIEPESGMAPRRIGALVVGGAGLAGVVVGSIFGIRAFSAKSDAVACNSKSLEECSKTTEDAHAASSREFAMKSNIGFSVGGIGLAAAVVLWATAPSKGSSGAKTGSLVVVPEAGRDGGGVSLRGVF